MANTNKQEIMQTNIIASFLRLDESGLNTLGCFGWSIDIILLYYIINNYVIIELWKTIMRKSFKKKQS